MILVHVVVGKNIKNVVVKRNFIVIGKHVFFLYKKSEERSIQKLNKVYRHWWQWLMNEP